MIRPHSTAFRRLAPPKISLTTAALLLHTFRSELMETPRLSGRDTVPQCMSANWPAAQA